MNEFLLEIYGEEIPSSAQAIAKNDLKDLFVNFLKNEKINFSSIETHLFMSLSISSSLGILILPIITSLAYHP